MTDAEMPQLPTHVQKLYTSISQEEFAQFEAGYQFIQIQQEMESIQEQLSEVEQQLRANATIIHELRPSSMSMAALARLEAGNVSDLDLLDQLLDQGDSWLDLCMQRLNYCEQHHLINDEDYTRWCQHALEGAYDWIDTMRESEELTQSEEVEIEPEVSEAPTIEEEQLLRRLASEDTDEFKSLYEDEDDLLLAQPLPKEELLPTPDNLPLPIPTITSYAISLPRLPDTPRLAFLPEENTREQETETEEDAVTGVITRPVLGKNTQKRRKVSRPQQSGPMKSLLKKVLRSRR